MARLKNFVKTIPIVGPLLRRVSRLVRGDNSLPFSDSPTYWEERYSAGGNSGSGSYNHLAEFKAQFINKFLEEKGITSAIEFGCGDGNQLTLIKYPRYIGLDVSPTTLQACVNRFSRDETKSFYVYHSLAFHDNQKLFKADVSLSLDVIYHLVEDRIFENYMRHLFGAGRRFVVIYSSDFESPQLAHVRNRKFTTFVDLNLPGWKLIDHIRNPYEYSESDEDNTSSADFFVYMKAIDA